MNTPFDSEIVLVTASTISNSDGQRLGFTALFLSNLAFQMANKSKWREIQNNYFFFRHTKYSWSSRPSLKANFCNSPESWLEIIFVVDGSVSKIKCSYTLDQCTGEICYFKLKVIHDHHPRNRERPTHHAKSATDLPNFSA